MDVGMSSKSSKLCHLSILSDVRSNQCHGSDTWVWTRGNLSNIGKCGGGERRDIFNYTDHAQL